MLSRIWLRASARLAARRVGETNASLYEDLVRRYAPGRSFVDVGGMWGINGANAFLADEVGATSVSLFDAMPPTAEFEAENARRDGKVRFVLGDLHAQGTPAAVGVHDVVWCTGLMYHTPSPLLALERLGAMAGEYLIVGTKNIPEVPGVPGAAVFLPALNAAQRSPYKAVFGQGIRPTFDTDPVRSYANWWWGLSRSALEGMLGLGMDVVETIEGPRGASRDNLIVVAKRRAVAST